MKLKIGENIKTLRRANDATQEELAEILGVSFQSVSRWENGTCYPDMELLPTIADHFGVTVDRLLGVDDACEQAQVARYLERFQTAVSRGDINECITVAREGVAEYPNNYALLNKLMYALFLAGDEDGNIPDWAENMKKYDAEITALGERIMKHCPDQEIRLEATARLAFNHCEMGRKETGRAIYETLPSANQCREQQMWWCLNDDEKLPFTRNRIQTGFDILFAGMYSLLCYRLLPDEALVEVCKKREALDALIYDGRPPVADWGAASFRCNFAKVYLRLGRTPEALEQLRLAVESARAFDCRPDEIRCDTLLLGETVEKRDDFETDDTRTLTQILRDKWLAHGDFNPIRDTPEFRAILEALGD